VVAVELFERVEIQRTPTCVGSSIFNRFASPPDSRRSDGWSGNVPANRVTNAAETVSRSREREVVIIAVPLPERETDILAEQLTPR